MHDALTGSVPLNNWLGIIGVLSLMYWGWRIIAALMPRLGHGRTAVEPSAATPSRPPLPPLVAAPEASRQGAPPEDIVVIAAAVHAMLGSARIVHIEPSNAGEVWALSGRWMHQTSHNLR